MLKPNSNPIQTTTNYRHYTPPHGFFCARKGTQRWLLNKIIANDNITHRRCLSTKTILQKFPLTPQFMPSCHVSLSICQTLSQPEILRNPMADLQTTHYLYQWEPTYTQKLRNCSPNCRKYLRSCAGPCSAIP